jgi:hypothetical protein
VVLLLSLVYHTIPHPVLSFFYKRYLELSSSLGRRRRRRKRKDAKKDEK